MTERLDDRWAHRDFPVLREIVRKMDEAPTATVRAEDVEAALAGHLTPDEVQQAAMNLSRAGLVSISGAMGRKFMRASDVSERALRLAGLWPDEQAVADQLLWVLEQKIDQAPTAEDRSRWVRIRDSIGAAGRDLTVELAAAMTMRTMGG